MGNAKIKATSNPTALEGFEGDVDTLVAAHAAKSAAEDKISEIRATLDGLAIMERQDLERRGIATKHVAFKGTGKDARYTFPDRYKPLPAVRVDDMRAMLGDTFGALFTRTTVRTLRPEALPALLDLLGAQASEYFAETPTISPVENFGAVRATARAALSDAANAALDAVVSEISPSPSLSVK